MASAESVEARPRPTFRQLLAVNRAARRVRRWPLPGPTGDDRFGLRLLRAQDRDAYFASIDHEVVHYQGFDAAVHSGMVEYFHAVDRVEKNRRLGLVEQPLVVEWEAGFAGIYTISPNKTERDAVHLGWWLAPEARTKGLGQASLAAVLDHVHRGIGARVARMGTNFDNARAIRQIEAVGAVRVGEIDHTLPNGRTVKAYWYHHTAD
jgi:RimJ/RimL family protein N-acetyltransferase